MNEEKNVKDENVEMSGSNDVDCQEKPCEEGCCVESKEEVINKITFLNSIEAIFLDQISIAIVSAVAIALLIAILNMAGYRILNTYYLFFALIAYIAISILYPAIMEACIGNTLGRKICKLKVFKTK